MDNPKPANFRVTLSARLDENLSPLVQATSEASGDYYSASDALDLIFQQLLALGLDPTREQWEGEESWRRSARHEGGGPILTRKKKIVVASLSATLLLGALEQAKSVIVEFLQNQRAASIEYRDGNRTILVHGRDDFEKLLEALRQQPDGGEKTTNPPPHESRSPAQTEGAHGAKPKPDKPRPGEGPDGMRVST